MSDVKTARWRKRPVVVLAWRWNGEAPDDRPDWVQKSGCYLTFDRELVVPTLEGEMLASVGDWIIEGVRGEVYPCKPDIFEATYEPAE